MFKTEFELATFSCHLQRKMGQSQGIKLDKVIKKISKGLTSISKDEFQVYSQTGRKGRRKALEVGGDSLRVISEINDIIKINNFL